MGKLKYGDEILEWTVERYMASNWLAQAYHWSGVRIKLLTISSACARLACAIHSRNEAFFDIAKKASAKKDWI
jgi:hypothetical protein